MIQLPSERRRKHIRIVRMLGVLLLQQVNGLLWDGDGSDRGFGFRAGDGTFSVPPHVLFVDRDGLLRFVQI